MTDPDRNPDAALRELALWCLAIARGDIDPPDDLVDDDDDDDRHIDTPRARRSW